MRKLIMILPLLLAACVKPLSIEEMQAGDYGKPPTNYQTAIKASFGKMLKDPTSPIYTFDIPLRNYVQSGKITEFGWMVCGTLNAKNQMGGYTGAQPFYAFFKGNYILDAKIAEENRWHKEIAAKCDYPMIY